MTHQTPSESGWRVVREDSLFFSCFCRTTLVCVPVDLRCTQYDLAWLALDRECTQQPGRVRTTWNVFALRVCSQASTLQKCQFAVLLYLKNAVIIQKTWHFEILHFRKCGILCGLGVATFQGQGSLRACEPTNLDFI